MSPETRSLADKLRLLVLANEADRRVAGRASRGSLEFQINRLYAAEVKRNRKRMGRTIT